MYVDQCSSDKWVKKLYCFELRSAYKGNTDMALEAQAEKVNL